VTDTIVLTRIAEGFSQIASQLMAFVKGPQRQKSGIAGDLAARKIGVNGSMSVEGENQLWYTVCHSWMLRRECWVHENPVFINLLEHPFFFHQTNRE